MKKMIAENLVEWARRMRGHMSLRVLVEKPHTKWPAKRSRMGYDQFS